MLGGVESFCDFFFPMSSCHSTVRILGVGEGIEVWVKSETSNAIAVHVSADAKLVTLITVASPQLNLTNVPLGAITSYPQNDRTKPALDTRMEVKSVIEGLPRDDFGVVPLIFCVGKSPACAYLAICAVLCCVVLCCVVLCCVVLCCAVLCCVV